MLLHAPGPERRAVPIHPILHAQKQITAHLEDTAQLERQRDLGRGREEPEHLHHVACDPGREDRDAEAFAGARAVVREYLGQGERGFYGEAQVADSCRVEGVQARHGCENEFEGYEGHEEVEEKMPVSAAQ